MISVSSLVFNMTETRRKIRVHILLLSYLSKIIDQSKHVSSSQKRVSRVVDPTNFRTSGGQIRLAVTQMAGLTVVAADTYRLLLPVLLLSLAPALSTSLLSCVLRLVDSVVIFLSFTVPFNAYSRTHYRHNQHGAPHEGGHQNHSEGGDTAQLVWVGLVGDGVGDTAPPDLTVLAYSGSLVNRRTSIPAITN